MTFPKNINLGSGKDFKPDCLNVDHGSCWQPDVVADLNHPFPPEEGARYVTKRFGEIVFDFGIFDQILANDLLEHLSDLTTCMRSCLDLLRVGGLLRVSVPYDLSLGAWSDPTHVRAFNERSWTYFCEWHWYLGWWDYRFQLQELNFLPSDGGRELAAAGKEIRELLVIPRAIDAMHVVLEKVELTVPEKELRTKAPFTRHQ